MGSAVVQPQTTDPAVVGAAASLAARFGLEVVSDDHLGWRLVHTGERVQLERTGESARPFFVDFGQIDLRTGPGNLSRRQPIGRAVGRETTSVLDMTAGFGHDAMLLALMGLRVLAVERDPVVAALFDDGVRRALDDPQLGPMIDERIEVVWGEGEDVLRQRGEAFEVAYVDPMFPAKRRASALPPRSMQILRELIGDGPDPVALLEGARQRARRVVVKRPARAAPLAEGVNASMGGKLVRYDVYLGS